MKVTLIDYRGMDVKGRAHTGRSNASAVELAQRFYRQGWQTATLTDHATGETVGQVRGATIDGHGWWAEGPADPAVPA
jgi:hypothetical protein